jgi:hypothetical protein
MLKHRIPKGILAAALTAAAVLVVSACNAAAVQAYINLAVQIALQIAQLAGVSAQAAGAVSADLAVGQKLYNDLAAADAAARPGILSQIDAELTTAQADLQNIFTLSHINDPKLQGVIRASLAIGITAIESARAIMLGNQPAPNPIVKAARVALPGVVVPKGKALTPAQLKSLYNDTVANYPQARLK